MSGIYRDLSSTDANELRSELRNLEGVAICQARTLDWTAGSNPPADATDRLAKAGRILAMVLNRIRYYDAQPASADDTSDTRTRVSHRAAELEGRIAALTM